MYRPIAEGGLLTAVGNAVLTGKQPLPPALYEPERYANPLNSARFTYRREAPHEDAIGASAWYRDLLERKKHRLWLWVFHPHLPLADEWHEARRRSRTARCAVQVDNETHSELWVIKDSQCRLIECAARLEGHAPPPDAALEQAHEQLHTAVAEMQRYSQEAGLEHWPGIFEQALEVCNARTHVAEPAWTLPQQLAPGDWVSGGVRGLLSSVDRAWVFEGQNAWNDLMMSGARHEEVTSRLEASCFLAFMAAVNHAV